MDPSGVSFLATVDEHPTGIMGELDVLIKVVKKSEATVSPDFISTGMRWVPKSMIRSTHHEKYTNLKVLLSIYPTLRNIYAFLTTNQTKNTHG